MLEQLLTLVNPGPNRLPTGPGPTDIVAGDETDGYYGLLTSAEFITPANLVIACGTQESGILLNNDTRWHKAVIGGKVIYHPFLPIRFGYPWDFLHAYGMVYGTKIINIQGYQFKVRLMTGSNPGVFVPENYPLGNADQSEFNRLIYRLTSEAPTGSNPNQFANYTLLELGLARSSISGQPSQRYICQERNGSSQCVLRNMNNGISGTDQWTALSLWGTNTQEPQNAWRPVLELIG